MFTRGYLLDVTNKNFDASRKNEPVEEKYEGDHFRSGNDDNECGDETKNLTKKIKKPWTMQWVIQDNYHYPLVN